MPVTYRTMLIGALALSGIPPLAGFFSKDEILATFNHADAEAVFWLGAAAAMVTAFYTFRMIFLTFHGTYLGHGHPHESPRLMTTPAGDPGRRRRRGRMGQHPRGLHRIPPLGRGESGVPS